MFTVCSKVIVVVEKMRNEARVRRDTAATGETPCDQGAEELARYEEAEEEEKRCYIAAALPTTASTSSSGSVTSLTAVPTALPESFTVGDNNTYGGYYNAPLTPNTMYTIWLGHFSQADGVCVTRFHWLTFYNPLLYCLVTLNLVLTDV